MSVSVIGLGRVGLMTLFHLAEKGFSPYAVDKDEEYIYQLVNKKTPFLEPGFNDLLKKHHKKIKFLTSPIDTKYNFISVPTPFNSLTQKIDLDPVHSVLNKFKNSHDKKYIFIRSTLAPGNCRQLSKQFQSLSINYFPEFFREGHFVEDYKNTDFSILASTDDKIFQIFSSFQFPPTKICSLEEAEILKSISNLFHGLKVSFANEVGRTAKAFRCSPHKIMELFGQDTKLNISKKYLKPGFSFGGPCLKKDIKSLYSVQAANQKQWLLAKYTEKSNEIHTKWVADQILDLNPETISVLGCSFTGSQTIDYRDSQVLTLVEILSKEQNIRIYTVEKILENYSCVLLSEESPEKMLESEVFIIGGWTPFLKKYKNLISNYKGLLFDLLIQDVPEFIKNHPHYKNIYSL